MRFLILSALLAVAAARHAIVKELQYGFCAGANEPFTIDEVVLEPYPIEVHSGSVIHLALGITLNEVIPPGSRVSLKIVKDLIIDFPIPCIPIGDIHLGSCEYDGQEILDVLGDSLCPTYFPEGQTCTLPLNPGQYGSWVGGPLDITLPDLPQIIVDLLGTGTYMITGHVYLPDGSEMTCIEISAEIVS